MYYSGVILVLYKYTQINGNIYMTLDINVDETIRFLNYIGGYEKNFHFQTYDDKKNSRTATIEEGSFSPLMAEKLSVVNRYGGGVFVAINTHKSGHRRNKKSTETVNAIFVDFDNVETSYDGLKQSTSILPATVTVESSPGKYHVYWVLSTPGSIAVKDFSIWQKNLATMFFSDDRITDSSRVMRLPGFIHQKNAPFVTRILDEFTTGKKYCLDELVSAFYGGRNCWLTSIAGRSRSSGSTSAELYDILCEYNHMLKIPLDDNEVETICLSVERYEPEQPKQVGRQISVLADSLGLEVNKYGGVVPHDRNTLKVVQNENLVRYNKLSYMNEIIYPALWPRGTESPQWEDSDSNSLKHYLNDKYGCDWSIININSAVDHVAMHNAYDPLLNYLGSLQWDKIPRLGQVFQKFLGVIDSPYVSSVAECLFVGAVKRAYDPGCKFDYMVVFVGEEGGGKSKFGSVIAKYNEFFTDSVGDIRNKDGVIGMMGKWIVEFPELKSLQGASSEHTKAFISTQSDNIRLPYGRRSKILPRRCVFIGSTNNDRFITDTGANRRMLPIYTPKSEESGDFLDYKALESEVDQLWAEAVHMYKSGHQARMPQSAISEMNAQRLQSTESGEYEQEIIAYMEDEIGKAVNGKACRRKTFHAKEFYMQTEGANRIAWGSYGSVIQNRVNNAAKKVFSLPEWSNYKHGRYMSKGVIWRGWKLIE